MRHERAAIYPNTLYNGGRLNSLKYDIKQENVLHSSTNFCSLLIKYRYLIKLIPIEINISYLNSATKVEQSFSGDA